MSTPVSQTKRLDCFQTASAMASNPDRVRRISDLMRTIVLGVRDFIIPLEGLHMAADVLYTTSTYISATQIFSLAKHYSDRDEQGNLKMLKGCGHTYTRIGSMVGFHLGDICDTIKLLAAWKLINLGAQGAQLMFFKHHIAVGASLLAIADVLLAAQKNGNKLDEKGQLTILANALKIGVISLVILQSTAGPIFFLTALAYGTVNVTRIYQTVQEEANKTT